MLRFYTLEVSNPVSTGNATMRRSRGSSLFTQDPAGWKPNLCRA